MSVLTYEKNELVMCKNKRLDPYAYAAKIKTVEVTGPSTGEEFLRYFVHYQGWNKRHDKWIEHDEVDEMISKHTPEIEEEHNQKRADAIEKEKISKKKKKSTETPASSTAKERITSRGGTAKTQQEATTRRVPPSGWIAPTRQAPCVQIPYKLLELLAIDTEQVLEQSKLVKLPARFTVDDIVAEYMEAVEHRRHGCKVPLTCSADAPSEKKEMVDKKSLTGMSEGFADYFDLLLRPQLLYEKEYSQYEQACVNPSEDAPGEEVNLKENPEHSDIKIFPSSIYGMPHLVRLFLRIGPCFVTRKSSEQEILIYHKRVADFLNFLCINKERYYDINEDYYEVEKKE